MKLLILAETIDVISNSAGKANYAFVQSLLSAGFEISVYHYSYKEILLPIVQPVLIQEKKTDINYWLSRGQRVLQRITKKTFSKLLENRFGFSFTFFNDVNSMVSALKPLSVQDYDLVLTLSKGASYRTHAALLKLPEWHAKWLAYIHDPYPFHWYPKPYDWVQPGSVQKEVFFKKVAQKAQWLGYPSQCLQDWMGTFDAHFKTKGIVLPHQPSEAKVEESIFPEFFDPDHFNVLHAGNLLKQRDPFPLIQAWNLFLEKYPEAQTHAKLLLIGPGAYHEPELSKVCKETETIYRYSGSMDYEQVRLLEHQSAVNIVLEAAAEVSPFLPAKFPNLVKANLPMLHLGPKHSEVRRLLGDDYQYVSEAGNIQTIYKLLIKLYDAWSLNKDFQLSTEIKEYFSSKYLGELIKGIIENKN
ncbi:UDP-glycosyltransferase [Leeuwenhoekiella aestuarii]|uniref:Glycosyltransferase involved in cell wall biosynthesis n=1 Tax=Leeuwenhoekiella aestuarii TaxID=2249426 RepID=A0A4Q0NPV7_9FLAO|nr:UDP-glycosyltransferase [Leeuwenhoekiella aestuarii]RXG12330.1 glycosyltransferase involved in cell wall biosynthesis [Leeuwenhoekiella aestuarii]